ncbi:MAG: hypothetical protein NTZ35_12820 [Ignavibacteriales bacterium]|nr:hypothetical protein [Ignavibacteriales bacterium]
MGYFIRILAASLVLVLIVGCSDKVKPSIAEMQPGVRAYLLGEKQKTCGGTVSVDHLTITKIGDYEDKYGGWPVYATFSIACVEGSGFSNWTNEDTSSTHWVTIVRQKMDGGYECYIPEIFRERDNSLSREMDRLPTDMTPKTK